jgi:hypothetical protein
MRNSPALPILALGVAAVLAVATIISYAAGAAKSVTVLSEAEIGMAAWAFTLAIYGVQGLVSVLTEGRELRPGVIEPRPSNLFIVAILVLGLALFGIATGLGWAIISDWRPRSLGLLAGAGCLDLALLLILYKEAFVGNEVRFDLRDDGVPW